MLFFPFSFRPCSGSVQTLGFAGFDGHPPSVSQQHQSTATGFSDDEVSLSPPRHSYVLELGSRHQAYQSTAYSDEELTITSNPGETTAAAGSIFCEHGQPHHRSPHQQQHYQRPRSCSQGRYRYHSHYYPDAL